MGKSMRVLLFCSQWLLGPRWCHAGDDWASVDCQAAELVADRDVILAQMGDVIAASIARRDTAYPVFHSCVDWHSSVHAHWALLRIARVTGQHEDRARAVANAFEPEKLDGEAAYLRGRPGFEMPYGRAWFLRLAIEYTLWCDATKHADADRLTAMADEVAASLVAFYFRHEPTPTTREYANDSWAIAQLYDYFVQRKDSAGIEVVSKLIDTQFIGNHNELNFRLDRERPDFFSAFGNWSYLIARTRDENTLDEFLKGHPISQPDLRPIDPLLPAAHHFGINWSRAWSLQALSQKAASQEDRTRFAEAFRKHVEIGMKQHREHVGDYLAYDHWVPQFAVYAVTECEVHGTSK